MICYLFVAELFHTNVVACQHIAAVDTRLKIIIGGALSTSSYLWLDEWLDQQILWVHTYGVPPTTVYRLLCYNNCLMAPIWNSERQIEPDRNFSLKENVLFCLKSL